MADDGMLVNFAIPETFASIPQKFKGGSWKERMRLKKTAKNRVQGIVEEKTAEGKDAAYQRATRGKGYQHESREEGHRSVKRRRENGEFIPSSKVMSRTSEQGQRDAKKPLGDREVISSLFSYNPTPRDEVADQDLAAEHDDTPTKPSNAPLPDGIDSFTSLGLSSSLSAHLLTKMNLKTPTAIQKASVSQLVKEDSDAFIQSETGSGKTLAYLLPIVQRMMTLAENSKDGTDNAVHRDSGLFAIVLAPTRELCKQISVVLERLLGCAHYIVAGTVIGGEKKKSEKARLRKGLNILVATPGRLVDHLDNTEALDVSQVRYLVLDEGDRLMDLGFEEDITKIVKALDSKKRKSARTGLPEHRITMLCSATLKMNVQKLGDISLKDAMLIKGDTEDDDTIGRKKEDGIDSAFLAPAQLKQSYLVVAAKLRFVTLTALLRRTFARKGSVMKAIVFVSCADSVEFHYKALTRDANTRELIQNKNENTVRTSKVKDDSSDTQEDEKLVPTELPPEQITEALQDAVSSAPAISTPENPLTLYKLHGSLPQASRTAIVKAFASTSTPSLLIATDVASRGLDLPNLDLVIEYDPAFSTDDHLHRIGRTARLGRDGRAIIFLLPGKEEGYVEVLKKSYKQTEAGLGSTSVTSQPTDEVLRKGFSPASGVVLKSKEWEQQATDFQLDLERWVLADPKYKEMAKKAFQSHIRAYATHVTNERKWFDIKELHLGHLAKAFGLRDPPGKVNVQGMRHGKPQANEGRKRGISTGNANTDDKSMAQVDSVTEVKNAKGKGADLDETGAAEENAKRMRQLVRNRKKMMGAGADEFNLA